MNPTDRNPPLSVTLFWLLLAAGDAIGTQAVASWLGASPRAACALAIGAGLAMLSVGGICWTT